MTRALSTLALALALPALAAADPLTLSITGGKTDETNVVVRFPVPQGANEGEVNFVELSSGTPIPAQVTAPAQIDDPAVKQYLVFVLPKLKAGETITAKPGRKNIVVAAPQFHFLETTGETM